MAACRRVLTHVTCRLTAKNRDQLRNPTLGNRVWATFAFTFYIAYCPHSRLAARQPYALISVLAGLLKRRLAGRICIVHPTGCTTGCVHTAGCITVCNVVKLTLKTSLDLNEARDDGVSGWQWHQLDHIQTICTSLQTDNHISTSSLYFYMPVALPDANQQCQSTEV